MFCILKGAVTYRSSEQKGEGEEEGEGERKRENRGRRIITKHRDIEKQERPPP
jgi:hypothetical protein